jgi:hypothetical protein
MLNLISEKYKIESKKKAIVKTAEVLEEYGHYNKSKCTECLFQNMDMTLREYKNTFPIKL